MRGGALLALVCACAGPNEAPQPSGPGRSIAVCLGDRTCRTPMLVAHRGEGVGEPENTLAAIAGAVIAGADAVEIDIRQTADGVFVLMHDGSAKRTTDQEGDRPIGELSAAEVGSLVIDDLHGRCAEPDRMPDRCRVPTLAAAVEAARGQAVLMLDWKGGDADALAVLLVATDAADTVFLFDADQVALERVRAQVPGLLVMPRARSAEEASALIAERDPALLHVDPGYAAQIDTAGRGTHLLIDIFLPVDPYFFAVDNGDPTTAEAGAEALRSYLDGPVRLLQTNYLNHARPVVDAWLAER
jgi:glycerophosphoryl diester phosphodiesterase